MEDRVSMVDVMMPAYNHEKFIGQAIESIVSQKTNFRFRLIIGEDCSKDNTRAVIRAYAEKYPDIIVPLFHEKNLGSTHNSQAILHKATAKYLALCEGDDYWIDENKLQQQYDVLESQPDKVLCFTKGITVDAESKYLGSTPPIPDKSVHTLEDVAMADMHYIPSATWLCRNVLPNPMPDFFYKAMSGDIATCIMLLAQGDAVYLPIETTAYRIHAGGITQTTANITQGLVRQFYLYKHLDKYLEYKFHDVFLKCFSKMSKTLLIYENKDKKGVERIKHALKFFPIYLKNNKPLNYKEVIYYMGLTFFPSLFKK